MPSQLELFARTPMKVEPAAGQSAPRLWVRRFVLQSEPGVVLQDVPLRKGLNVVWSPDPGDTDESVETTALGHGAGKTLFCRLLRYCLGEARFAPEGQREDIAAAFPDGLVGVEVVIDGEDWAVTRSIGQRRQHIAARGAALETLMYGEMPSTGMDEFVSHIGDRIVTAPVTALIPGSRPDRAWLTALAWLARDQECRFGDVLDWRAAASDSDSPVRGFSRGDALLALRALVGALSPAERDARVRSTELEAQLAVADGEARHRDWESARLRKELCAAIDLRDEELLPGRLAIEALRRGALTRLALVQQLPANDVDERDDLKVLRSKLESARHQASSLAIEVAKLQDSIRVARGLLSKAQSELPASSFATDAAENPVCRVCEVPIDRALADGCKLSRELHDVETMRRRHERLKQEVDGFAQQIERDVNEERSLTPQLVARSSLVASLRARVDALEAARDARADDWAAAVRVLDDVRRLDSVLVEHEGATNRAAELRARTEATRKDTADLRGAQADVFNRLGTHFHEVVRHLVSATAAGSVKLTGRSLELAITMGGNRSTAAIESLKVIAFDLATMILAIEGRVNVPAFLLHDSPREADLGLSSYHQLFALARLLEELSPEPLFQYIVTTTTRPPDDVRRGRWLRLILKGGPPSERLLRRDL